MLLLTSQVPLVQLRSQRSMQGCVIYRANGLLQVQFCHLTLKPRSSQKPFEASNPTALCHQHCKKSRLCTRRFMVP